MHDGFYFRLSLTENEHYIVADMFREFCKTQEGMEVKYYRKLKTGHVPCIRECKIVGGSGPALQKFIKDNDILLIPREEYTPNGAGNIWG